MPALGVLPHMPVLRIHNCVNNQVSNRDQKSLDPTRESMFEPYDTHPAVRTYFHKKHIRQVTQHDLTEVHYQHFRNQNETYVMFVTKGILHAFSTPESLNGCAICEI